MRVQFLVETIVCQLVSAKYACLSKTTTVDLLSTFNDCVVPCKADLSSLSDFQGPLFGWPGASQSLTSQHQCETQVLPICLMPVFKYICTFGSVQLMLL